MFHPEPLHHTWIHRVETRREFIARINLTTYGKPIRSPQGAWHALDEAVAAAECEPHPISETYHQLEQEAA